MIMTDFAHSIVLFSGEDGLPLEFNIRNTNEKELLKLLIEHGGGLCSQSNNSVHLISPGTTALNTDLGKKLVSTQYIFDCVKQNYLLDVNDYVFTITEARTSDISDEMSNDEISETIFNNKKANLNECDNIEVMSVNEASLSSSSTKDKNSTVVAATGVGQDLTSSNTSESFVKGSVESNSNFKLSSVPAASSPEERPLTSTAKDAFSAQDYPDISYKLSPIKGVQLLLSPVKTKNTLSSNDLKLVIQSRKEKIVESFENISLLHSMSTADFDDFDNLLLSKAQQKHESYKKCLSQNYTVSSSADGQIGSKPNSEDIFAEGSSAVPDSPINHEMKEQQTFIKELETEVNNILKKPSPKSIQDKICLVKYLCCIMKLPPAKVLEMLPRF